MLTYKKYKELKERRKFLNYELTCLKYVIKTNSRAGRYVWLSNNVQLCNRYKIELNLINEVLKMHKILWKQYLHNQEYFRNV